MRTFAAISAPLKVVNDAFEFELLDRIHECYENAGFDGPAEIVAWMEKVARKGENPIPRLRAIMGNVCTVLLAVAKNGEYKTSGPTLLAWFDRSDKSFVLEVRE